MLIVAKSKWERGYMYSIKSAHRVPQRRAKAEQITEILNANMFNFDTAADIWRVYEIDEHDVAYETAQHQRFGFREHGKYLVEYTR